MEAMIKAGMNVARINFSHGDFGGHKQVIDKLRAAARALGRRIAVMADLPGPKMRIGRLADEPVELQPGALFTLTTRDIVGDAERVSVSFSRLPQALRPGDTLFLNDGLIQLETVRVEGSGGRLPGPGGRGIALPTRASTCPASISGSAPSPITTANA